MFVEKLSDEQIKHLISPKFYDTLSNFGRTKWNGRLYINYNCCGLVCKTILEDFCVVYSDFPINEAEYRKFMMQNFGKKYFINFSCFIEKQKAVEAKEEIHSLKNL